LSVESPRLVCGATVRNTGGADYEGVTRNGLLLSGVPQTQIEELFRDCLEIAMTKHNYDYLARDSELIPPDIVYIRLSDAEMRGP
jgi:hypothetical protein